MPQNVQVGTEVLIRAIIMQEPNDSGGMSILPLSYKDGGAEWSWVNVADIHTVVDNNEENIEK